MANVAPPCIHELWSKAARRLIKDFHCKIFFNEIVRVNDDDNAIEHKQQSIDLELCSVVRCARSYLACVCDREMLLKHYEGNLMASPKQKPGEEGRKEEEEERERESFVLKSSSLCCSGLEDTADTLWWEGKFNWKHLLFDASGMKCEAAAD
jgi:hypothetical protein